MSTEKCNIDEHTAGFIWPIAFCLLAFWVLPSQSVTKCAEPPITSLALAPDAHSLVVGSQAGVQIRALPSLEIQRTFIPQFANVHALAFSPDNQRIAVAGGDPADAGAVEILSWPKLESLQFLTGHDDSVMAIEWLSDNKVASASLDQRVIVWDVSNGEQLRVLQGHSRGITSLAYVQDHGVLVSGGIDQSLRVWRIETGELLNSLTIHTQPVNGLATRPTLEGLPMIASCSDDRTVRFWQPTIGRMVRFVRLPARPLCMRWLSDGARIAAGCDDGRVYLVNPDTVKVTDEHTIRDSGWIYALSSTSADKLISGGSYGKISFLDP